MIAIQQESVKELVAQVKKGSDLAFDELVVIAKPLLISTSNSFSRLHHKFTFEDFYSICLNALYQACLSYQDTNPSFLSYSKVFMLRHCWSELEYWNMAKRNIFDNKEITSDSKEYVDYVDRESLSAIYNDVAEVALDNHERKDFREKVSLIIDELYGEVKGKALKMYVFEDKTIKEISEETGLNYQNTYSIIKRGMKKIVAEYDIRYLDK